MSDKIINTFQQRRELQNQIALLEESKTEGEMLKIVRAIAHDFPADMVLKVLVKALNTSNSQLRGGLAHLATMLAPEEAIATLKDTVADRSNSTQTRLNSVTILERFLGEEVSPALLGDLENTDEIAFQSLCEAVEEGHRERHIFLEYVVQMREEDVEVAYIVMNQLRRLPATDQLDLLRLMAQDEREPVALAALKRLEQLDPEDTDGLLSKIFHSLQFTLPPDLAKQAERFARKLRFNGHGYKVPEPIGWRALVSPAEASGNQTVWFFTIENNEASDAQVDEAESARSEVVDDEAADNGESNGEVVDNDEAAKDSENESPFVSIVINRATGILQTYGSDHMPLSDLPSPHSYGELMTVALDGGDSIVFLEAPFDYGRWLVQSALEAHWSDTAWQPLFGEYSLYNDMLWQFGQPELPESLSTYFQPIFAINGEDSGEDIREESRTDTDNESLSDSERLDRGQPSDELTVEAFDKLDKSALELLSHPAMGSWVLHSYLFWNAIRAGFPREEAQSSDELTQMVLKEIMKWPEHDVFVQGIVTGLQGQAAWLTIAGMQKSATQASQLAESFSSGTLEQNPFLYRYVRQAIEAKS